MPYTAETLLFRNKLQGDGLGLVNRVTAAEAGWELLNAELRRFAGGESWTHDTGEHESVLVLLGGRCSVRSSRGE